MNPALLNFGLAQEQADGPLGGTNSPISNGALTAIRSVKQSLAMDEAEKRRALGLGLIRFASSLSQPGYGQGLSGMLGAVNAGFSPAVQAYLNEQNRIEHQNANVLRTVVDTQDKQADRDFRERQLQETKRYHNIMGTLRNREAQLEKENERVKNFHSDAIPLNGMSPGERTAATKKQNDIISSEKSSEEMVKNLGKLANIAKNNPALYESWSSTLDPDSFWGRKLMSNETRAAKKEAQLIKKNLALSKIEKGVGSARMGQFMEKLVEGTKPDELMPPQLIEELYEEAKIHHAEIKNAAERARIAKKGRYDLPDYFYSEEAKAPETQELNTYNAGVQIDENIIQQLRAQHPELKDYSNEEIWEAYQ